jgi:hypothetical protein
MSDDSLARNHPASPSDVDGGYDAIHATIVATERGRWFLDQFANHYRGADTDVVLAAIDRLEEAIRGPRATAPADPAASTLASLLDTVRLTRDELLNRHGDPAARGDAAIADFHNAAQQIQELVWARHGRETGSEIDTQLAFQINRLTGAGERLQRSVDALRILMALVEDLDQRFAVEPVQEPSASTRPEPQEPIRPAVAEAQEDVSAPEPAWNASASRQTFHDLAAPATDTWPDDPALPEAEPTDAMLVGEDAPVPVSLRDAEPEPHAAPHAGAADVLQGLTIAPAAEREDEAAPPAAETEALVTDWAFAPTGPETQAEEETALEPETFADPEPELLRPLPPAEAIWPSHETAAMPEASEAERTLSALERLEAREYGRRLPSGPATTPEDTPGPTDLPRPTDQAEPAEPGEPAARVGLNDLVLGLAPSPSPDEPESETDEWSPLPADTPEAIFDSDLFDSDEAGDEPTDAEAVLPAPEAMSALVEDTTADDTDLREIDSAAPDEAAAFLQDLTEDTAAPESGEGAGLKPVGGHDLLQEDAAPSAPPLRSAFATRPPSPASGLTRPTAETPAAAAPSAPEVGGDTPSVLQRLESMRAAIASLMDEVNEKAARRNPPGSP